MQLSRRTFLENAAGAGLAWGGMRIFAGPRTASAHAVRSASRESSRAGQFLYGSAFYRPPNPPREQRREMLRALAQEHKFNIIRIYPAWVYYHPEPKRFIFDDVDEVMSYCDEFGVKVLMGIVTEEAPYWLEQAHPETRYVDAKGNPQRLAGSGNNVSGGWPGLCLDWEPVRQAAREFIHALAKMAAAHPSMYAYDTWNEPHIEPAWARNIWAVPQELLYCYCDRTVAHFHEWLQKRYGTIDRLNEAWVRRYPNWKAIDPPRAMGTYMEWVDWRRFIIDRSTWELQFRVEAVREADSKHVLEDHAAHHPPVEAIAVNGTNGWRLAEQVETWGLSLFPRWFGFPVFLGAAKIEITRSNAPGKDFWMTELQGGHGSSGLWRSPKMRPRDIRLWNWLAVAAGARGIIYWTYHTEATGSEATGFGLVDRAGAPTERVREAAANNRLIQAYWDILKDYRPQPEVAILTDPDNALLTYAMAGKEDASTESFRGYYKALWNLDLWADFIEPASLAQAGYKVIIVPWHLIGKQQTCEALRRFVEAGGTLILESGFGLFDERMFHNPVIPPHGLAEAFGYQEKESYYITSGTETQPVVVPRNLPTAERIYFEPELEFSEPVATKIKAHTFLTPLELTSATPIARHQDMTVAAMKKLGSGRVFYFGTNLGASIAAGNDGGIELLRGILHSIVQPPVTADKVRPRLIAGEQRSLLVVFNDSPEDRTGIIPLPSPFRRVRNIHTDAELALEQNSVRVTVPFQDVVVALLE
jgi:beta-galactosidase